MEREKKGRSSQSYVSDFKEEIISMLNSGRNVSEILRTFGIGQNVLQLADESKTKVNTKTMEEQRSNSLKVIAENERLKKENARVNDKRDIYIYELIKMLIIDYKVALGLHRIRF